MTVLPIVDRELAAASRRAATFWLRFWVAAGAMAVFFLAFLDSSNSLTETGYLIFIFLGSGMLCFSMMAGVFLTADSLSTEKREGTLGLLFLTDLKGYDVVLGKLAANSLQAFFGLLAVFPVLALPMLTGGLSGGEFWRTILVLTVTMYFSLAIGMLVSAASRDGRQTVGGAFAAILLPAGVLPLLWELQTNFLRGAHPDFLLWLSPVYAYIMGFDRSYLRGSGPREFWTATAALFSMASGCIAAACIILPRSWQRSAAADPNTERPRFQFLTKARRWRRPALGNQNPFHWLALGDRGGRTALNRMLVLPGLLWAGSLVFLLDNSNIPFAIYLAFGLHFAAKVLIATESGRRFHLDRQSGAMELLMVTPLPARDIVAGQRDALRKQFRPALWLISVVNVVTLVVIFATTLGGPGGMPSVEVFAMLEVFIGGMVMLWLDANALIWLGMWRGLKAKKYPRSVLANLGQVLLIPWIAVLFFALLGGGISEDDAVMLVLLWFGLGAVVDGLSIAFAEGNLAESLRSIVSGGNEGR